MYTYNHYSKYDDDVCSKLFPSREQKTSEVVVRRALRIYVQQKLIDI